MQRKKRRHAAHRQHGSRVVVVTVNDHDHPATYAVPGCPQGVECDRLCLVSTSFNDSRYPTSPGLGPLH